MVNRVLCVGHVNWDITIHTSRLPEPDFSEEVTGEHKTCGGSATNTALTLQSFDENEVSMYGCVGDDEYGDKLEEQLSSHGINSRLQRTGIPTTVIRCIITDNADPRYLAKDEEVSEITPDGIHNWSQYDHLHTTSFSSEYSGVFAEKAKEDGLTVSFNPSQGYQDERFDTVVENADVIILNEREADIFRDRHSFPYDDDTFMVVTHGADGSTLYHNGESYHHPGFTSEELVDTIGAGDSFISGFLTEWLKESDYETCLKYGNACGSLSVEEVGSPEFIDPVDVAKRVGED